MNSTTVRGYRIALASVAFAGLYCSAAGAGTIGVGVPSANSGSLLYNEAQGGFLSKPSMRSDTGSVQVGVPANSGSLYYNEAQGGILSKPNIRSTGSVQVGAPQANSGSLYYNEAQGGIMTKPSMRTNETGQSAASLQQDQH
jgi:hypothetical protein